MKLFKALVIILFLSFNVKAQETLPIYHDYLSDNVYLIHPAAAGVGECGKIRLTARQQWAGVKNAPNLQTLTFHNKFNPESKAAYGAILFNDENGFHSQKGFQATFAYHLPLFESEDFNQLSFGLSASGIQNQVDQRSFYGDRPEVIRQLIESDFYFNVDLGMSYHQGGLSSYFTVKNVLLAAKNNSQRGYESLNLRNFVFGVGYFFGNKEIIEFEPSMMFQYRAGTGEKIADVNVKAYKTFKDTQLWMTLSYRRGFDHDANLQPYSQITPIIGVNYKKIMLSYTYTRDIGDVVISPIGYHQLTLGFDLFCSKRRGSACPNVSRF